MDRVIYTFWTGENEMSQNRKEALSGLIQKSEIPVVLITPKNINYYTDKPIHEAYNYLSETHKADYLRTHFMHFHGGGYSDIKKTTGSWLDSFENLQKSDKWICGYKEIKGGVAYGPLHDKWDSLIGNGAYICKPNTPLTNVWYNEMISLLDKKLDRLKSNPAKHPQDQGAESGYPIEWNEMLGRIFHKVSYDYKDYILRTLPISVFTNYR